MDVRNVSELFGFKRITRNRMEQIGYTTLYWQGEDDWTEDHTASNIVVAPNSRVEEFSSYLFNEYGYLVDTIEVESDLVVMEWPCGTWVVLNPQDRGTPHRIQFVGTHGDGYYMKDEGTTERELVLRRNEDFWSHVTIRGKQIIGCNAQSLDGDVLDIATFGIPQNGNLKYQFEYEAQAFRG